ncbi:MAG: ABC transporter permease [Ardenticatenaceae bacterium]|nr:ABC transporter permease [Ardenticatenaceae bacterium]
MKIWTIAWKDTQIRFRDRNAVILMIIAPLLLSAIIGSAFGGFVSGGNDAPLADIPLIIVNEDEGELGQTFTNLLTADIPELVDLLEPTEMDNLGEARAIVQAGDSRAVVYIPADFSERVQSQTAEVGSTAVRLYTDPAATITPNIIRAVVTQIVNEFVSRRISAQITAEYLSQEYAATLGPAMANLGTVIAAELQAEQAAGDRLSLNRQVLGEANNVNPFAFFVPSMGIFFLVFAMMDGTRSILEEDREGTLDRLISTPTSHSQILLGKILGVFLTGLVQFTVYVVASRLLFNVNWGHSLVGLVLLTVTTVSAFTSLGAFLAAFARDANQANIFGSVVALVSGALGGNFTSPFNFPDWLNVLSRFTVNRWSIDGFADLTLFQLDLVDVLPEIGVLLAITAVFFALGLWQFQRRIAR